MLKLHTTPYDAEGWKQEGLFLDWQVKPCCLWCNSLDGDDDDDDDGDDDDDDDPPPSQQMRG